MVKKDRIKLLLIVCVSLMISSYCIVMAQDVVISSGVIISTDVYGDCDLSDNRNSIVINNSLRIEDRNIQGNAYGGYSREGKVQENILEMTGGTINESAYGGRGDQEAINNRLSMVSGNITEDAYGGYSDAGSAQENILEMTGGTINKSAYGGRGDQEVINNRLKLKNGNMKRSAYGGYSDAGSAQENILEVTGGTIDEHAYGGRGLQEGINNTLKISGGNIGRDAYGGYSDAGSAQENILEITGGTIGGGVYGGLAYEESINNNVIIRGGKFGGNMYVGYSLNERAVGNRLEISGTPEFSTNTHIYGGYSVASEADTFTDNVFDIKTNNITIAGMGGFQYLNFYNPVKDGNPVITCTTSTVKMNNVKITVKMDADKDVNTTNDKYFLIRSMGGLDGSINEKVKVKRGLLSRYDTSISINNFTELAIIIIKGYINPRAAIITQSKATTVEIVNEGLDLIIEKGIESAREASMVSEGLVPFVALKGGKSKLSTGWDINVAGLGALAGVAKEINKDGNKITIGGFVEHGRKTSDMSEEIEDVRVSAGLSGEYSGGGALARMGMLANSYIEGSLRIGSYKVGSDVYNLDEDNPQRVTYDYNAMYLGGHVGIGYIYKINDKFNIDINSKFLLMYQEGKELKLSSGDNIKFRDMETGKVRVGTKLDYKVGKQVLPYIGINYEYEVLGKEIRAKTADIDLPEVDVKRGRVVGEVGISKDIGKFKIDGSVIGYMGSKEGCDAMLKIKFCL
ncbi:MAG: autotransporter outer membrane beta-barrel domain-containing protein [Endomicrobium sp.]|jgi:hypothetical protein|nr:autotransporter outer membrane beta-barrel domain-containing protein [Endomicrobium sp.]